MTDELRILQNERFKRATSFGSLTPERLQQMLDKGARGEPEEWAEFCEYALEPNSELSSSMRTVRANVLSGPWMIDAGESPDKDKTANDKAEFIKATLQKMKNFPVVLGQMIDAILPGYSAHELVWKRDDELGANIISEMIWTHQRRFRWDESWKLRLWDYGLRGDPRYGDPLKPSKWCVFVYLDKSSYPGRAGLMREVCWPWLFTAWANKFWIHGVENYGSPRTVAKVPDGTLPATMLEVKRMLDNLSYDSTAVFREATEIIQLGGPAGADDGMMYKLYIDKAEQKIAKIILGSTDINEAGITGSRAAVETRVDNTLNPRVIGVAQMLWSCLREQVFTPLITNNLHLFGGTEGAIPVGRFGYQDAPKYDTEGIESTSSTAKTGAEIQALGLNGAQVDALLNIITEAVAANIPRETAIQLLTVAFPAQIDIEKANAILGKIGVGFVAPVAPETSGNPPAAASPVLEPLSKEKQNANELKKKQTGEGAAPVIAASSDILPAIDRYEADPEWDTAEIFRLDDTDRAINAKKIGKVKDLVERSVSTTADILNEYRDEMADGIKGLKNIDGLTPMWNRLGKRLKRDRALIETIRTALVTPFVAGKAMVAAGARKQFVMSDVLALSEKSLFQMPWDEAIDAYKKMPIFDEKGFDNLKTQSGKKAASVVDDIVSYLRDRSKTNIEAALKEGGTFGEYAEAMLDENQKLGIEPSDPAYLNMVFRTNTASAYGAGRWAAQLDTAKDRPYWEYVTVGDGRVRDEHRLLDGKIFQIGNARTDRLAPPNGFNCRCVSMSWEKIPAGKRVEESDRPYEAAYGAGFDSNPLDWMAG